MRTKDLNFSAFLMAHGERLTGVEPDEYGKYCFIFSDSLEIARLSDEYYLCEAQVNAQQFAIAQKKLKAIVRNYNPNHNIKNEPQFNLQKSA
jgi:hypothetical protein